VESFDRNAAYLLGHFGFLFFNLCNVFAIVIFHGYVFRTIKGNYKIRMALPACIFQIGSCICSIIRYNINDENGQYGSPYAIVSTALGLIGFTFFNIVVLQIMCNHKKTVLHVMVALWIVVAIVCFVVTEILWEDVHFMIFRGYIIMASFQQLIAYSLILVAVKKDTVKIDEKIMKKEYQLRVIHSCIFLLVLALGLSMSRCPALIYPSTGLSFTIMVVMASMLGEAEFSKEKQWWNCFAHFKKNEDDKPQPESESTPDVEQSF
jgi:hypothetical protein